VNIVRIVGVGITNAALTQAAGNGEATSAPPFTQHNGRGRNRHGCEDLHD
jgi:hypothetical protein